MSPTFLEVTVGLIAAVLVFMFALRIVPLIIDALSTYFDKTVNVGETDEKETHEYER